MPETLPLPHPTVRSQENGGPSKRMRANAWHRRAGRPVQIWLALIVVTGLFHWAIPDHRWLLIHLFTLGALTNSIQLWSQHFTENFLHTRLEDHTRVWQVRRIWILNAGIVLTLVGKLADVWQVTAAGATVVGGSLLFHACYLAWQFRTSSRGQRYRHIVIAYVLAACCLPVGAVFGAMMAAGVGSPLKDQLLLAHLVVNLLGFVGLTAMGSLMVIFPTIWRTGAGKELIVEALALCTTGVVVASGAALFDAPKLAGMGLLLYAAGWALAAVSWVHSVRTVLQDPRDRISFSAASVAMAPLWLFYGIISTAIHAFQADAVLDIDLPTLPLVVGFAAQLLLGVMSYLLPSNIGGGPGATRTGLYVMGSGGLLRATLINVGLALWLAADTSWLRVALSILVLGSLAVFLVLTPMSVRAQLGVLRKKREPLDVVEKPRWNQVSLGLAILALVVACFGGLGTSPSSSTPAAPTGPVTEVTIDSVGMRFSPDVIEVPLGNALQITLNNNGEVAHDLKLATGEDSGRILPGESATFTTAPITADVEGWCTIAGHKQQGMTLQIVVTPAQTG